MEVILNHPWELGLALAVVLALVFGTSAYIVISATLLLKLKGGQSSSRPGILTFTLAKQGDEWKVGSQAWGRLS